MAKSGVVRRQLQQAALELFEERGYDQTTAAEIADRAGVTERTFFRYFADKRDVLFDGETILGDVLRDAVRDAPADMGPWDVLFEAFRSSEHLFIENRSFTLPRHRVIQSSPGLRERAQAKTRAMIEGLDAALRERGVPGRLATLAAQIGAAALSHAVSAWFADGSRSLDDHLVQAFDEVRNLTSADPQCSRKAKPAR